MQIAYIKFNSREDQVRGFYALATKAQVTSLPGGVYAVPWQALALLDAEGIAYRRATDAAEAPGLGEPGRVPQRFYPQDRPGRERSRRDALLARTEPGSRCGCRS